MNSLPFLLVCCAGWMNRHQQVVIDYLQEEIRVLNEQLGKRPRFNDDQRRRLAVKGKPVGRKICCAWPASSPRTPCWHGIAG